MDDLKRELEALRRRVAELEVPARRFQALFESGFLSVHVLDASAHIIAVNSGWKRLWQVELADVADWSMLEDEQIERNGFMDRVERAFYQGEATPLPTIRFDPHQTEVKKGSAQWVVSSIYPVKDASGAVQEVVMMHMEVGELTQSADELRRQKEELERAVAERTADLEQQLRVIEAQQREIFELSTPILTIGRGVLALPLIGRVDADRGVRIREELLERIAETGSDRVVIDLTGVPFVDEEVARSLHATVRAAALLGAKCAIVGISKPMARALTELDLSFEDVPTLSTLQAGLRWATVRREQGSSPGGADRL